MPKPALSPYSPAYLKARKTYQSLPSSAKSRVLRLYRRILRHAGKDFFLDHPAQAAALIAAQDQGDTQRHEASLALRLAHATMMSRLRRRGASARVRRKLTDEAFHLVRIILKAGGAPEELSALLGHGIPHDAPVWKLYCDGSFRQGSSRQGIILEDPLGFRRLELAMPCEGQSALEAELGAITTGLESSRIFKPDYLHAMTDSLAVLVACKGGLPEHHIHRVRRLHHLAGKFAGVRVQLVPRTMVRCADALATLRTP